MSYYSKASISKNAFALFLVQFIIILAMGFFLFSLINFDWGSQEFFIDLNSQNIIILAGLLVLFILIEFFALKKLSFYRQLSLEVSSLINFTFKKKMLKTKTEPRIGLLLFLELFFSFFIAYSFFVVLDAESEFLGFLDWSHIPQSLVIYAKISLFLIALILIFWLYSKTKEFRTVVLNPSPGEKLVTKIKTRIRKN